MDQIIQKTWTWLTITILSLFLGLLIFVAKSVFSRVEALEVHTPICDTDRAKLNTNVDNLKAKIDEIGADVKQILRSMK